MNLRTKIIRYAVVILSLLWTGVVFYCGYTWSDRQNQLEWAEYKEQVSKQNLVAVQQVQQLEQKLAKAYQEADQGAQIPLMLLCLTSCKTTVPIPQLSNQCPQRPQLPARFVHVETNTMQKVDELLENYEQTYLR